MPLNPASSPATAATAAGGVASSSCGPLQIQPKPVVTILGGQTRLLPPQTFSIQPNNHFVSQQRQQPSSSSFTLTLAPIAAKPASNEPQNTGPGAGATSSSQLNFQPIQMRPATLSAAANKHHQQHHQHQQQQHQQHHQQQHGLGSISANTGCPSSGAPSSSGPQLQACSSNITAAASSSSSSFFRDWILEAIDKLRERKARPDADRISTLMKRYHNVPLEETVAGLARLADSGAVVCVDYKGNVSYRNPYKWRKNSANGGGGGVINPPSVTQRLLEAVRHLDRQQQQQDLTAAGAVRVGYSVAEIEAALSATHHPGALELARPQLRHAIDREAAYGKLMRRPDATYVVDESGDKKSRRAAAIQAKKTGTASGSQQQQQHHKPLVKTLAPSTSSSSHIITIPAPAAAAVPSSFTTFSVQPMPSYASQLGPFVSPYFATTATSGPPQPQPLLPKNPPHPLPPPPTVTAPATVKYEATIPQRPPATLAPLSATTPTSNSGSGSSISQAPALPLQSLGDQQQPPHKPASKTCSRRGRPPGSKNKRQELLDAASAAAAPQLKRLKPETVEPSLPAAQGGVPSATSSLCSGANSDLTVPATGATPVSQPPLCTECRLPQSEYERFLLCNDCPVKVHPSCLHYWPELTERARQSHWQCSACKTCSVCKDKTSKEPVYICDGCDQGYHAVCHSPRIKEPVSRNAAWICTSCYGDGFRVRSEETPQKTSPETASIVEEAPANRSPPPATRSKTPPAVSVIQQQPENGGEKVKIKRESCVPDCVETAGKENVSTPAPVSLTPHAQHPPASSPCPPRCRPHDVTQWSVDDVCSWLKEEGFHNQSSSFRDQEIDGACLLLMKRIDVLTELNIKLGPAVKIYEKIKRIQTEGSLFRVDDSF